MKKIARNREKILSVLSEWLRILDTPLPEGERILLSTTHLAHAGLHQRE
jgi:hypothetical protein